MNVENITHIHLKKSEDEVHVYMVNNNDKTEECVSVSTKDLHMPQQLSRAIIFVESRHVPMLINAKIASTVITHYVEHQVSSLVLTHPLHQYFDTNDEIFFELKTMQAGVIQ